MYQHAAKVQPTAENPATVAATLMMWIMLVSSERPERQTSGPGLSLLAVSVVAFLHKVSLRQSASDRISIRGALKKGPSFPGPKLLLNPDVDADHGNQTPAVQHPALIADKECLDSGEPA